MSNQVVRVKRKAIAACMTCPICNKLLRDAMTISECLHTFCRKCICKKLDEELECCPICNIDLGCAPLEKLRPDHNLQDVIAKIFPSKRRRLNNAPEAMPSIVLPARRKERSLSSLVVDTPRVSTKSAPTGRRSKVAARKTSQGSSFSNEKQIKKEEDSDPESSSSRETLTKFTQNIRQNSSTGEPSSDPKPDIETENGADKWEEKGGSWKPLNFLVEVANRSKSSSKFPTSQGSASKPEPNSGPKSEGLSRKTKLKSKVQDETNSADVSPPESAKPKKFRRMRPKKAATLRESGVSPQAVLDATSTMCEKILNPVWCSLVASEEQEGYEPLPQISASFLRIKDGSLSVAFIQKYLMKKLELPSEDDVEIRCMGQAVVPTLQLRSLVELWLQTVSPSEKVSATIGSSAKEFVMVLGYARKVPPP